MSIGIIDYGMANLRSVQKAFEHVAARADIIATPEQIDACDKLVLPGVGAFGECMANLRASGVVEALEEAVFRKATPLFGICVGLQLMAREGHEMGVHAGLNWVPGIVRRFAVEETGLKVPHVGWNEVEPVCASPMFQGFRRESTFYFTHSYHLALEDRSVEAAACEYGERFTAAILKGNIIATQFHPEKSQENGLKLLENFLEWKP